MRGVPRDSATLSVHRAAGNNTHAITAHLPCVRYTTSMDIAHLAGFLNLFSGVLLVAGIGFFISGFFKWITHLGLPHRDEGIVSMSQGVSMLFFLVIMLWVVRIVQYHTQAVMRIITIAVVLFGGWIVIKAVQAANAGAADEH